MPGFDRAQGDEKPSYDEWRIAAVLTKCSVCGKEWYATTPTDPYICIACRQAQK